MKKQKEIVNLEEVITGEEEVNFYKLLMNPPKDPVREKIIKEALELFLNPGKPTIVEMDL